MARKKRRKPAASRRRPPASANAPSAPVSAAGAGDRGADDRAAGHDDPVLEAKLAGRRLVRTIRLAIFRPRRFADDWVARPDQYLTPRELLVLNTSLVAASWWVDRLFEPAIGDGPAVEAPTARAIDDLLGNLMPIILVAFTVVSLRLLAWASGVRGRGGWSPAIRAHAMSTAIAVLALPALTLVRVANVASGDALLVDVASVFVWGAILYAQLRYHALAVELFYGVPYRPAAAMTVGSLLLGWIAMSGVRRAAAYLVAMAAGGPPVS